MRRIHRFETIDSTMRCAADLARDGAPSGTVVVADEQTAGQGRLGRSWYSAKGDGLYVSMVLRLDVTGEALPVVTLALGLATADAIMRETGLAPDLRWPNDVMVNGKKCAGILVQLQDSAVIAGIGVNVNHAGFPADLAQLATSLRIATRLEQSRERLLQSMLDAVDASISILEQDGKEAILRLFAQSSSYVTGRRVFVDQPGQLLEGTTDGLDESGFLILRQNDGRRTLVMAGGVRPAS